MPATLLLATAVGVVIAVQAGDRWQTAAGALSGTALTSIAAVGAVVVVGDANGIWRSADGGRTWQRASLAGPPARVRWLSRVGDEPTLLAGTEPAGILVSRDGGAQWTPSPEVAALRDHHGWFLPYSPEAGCIRAFAAAPPVGSRAQRIYGAAEVGGVLVSDDDGASWRLADGSDGSPRMDRDLGRRIHPDVHDLAVFPNAARRLAAATGGGLYVSADGGGTWTRRHGGYVRSVWIDPEDPDRIVIGPAGGVSRNGRIEVSTDGGASWHPWTDGTDAPWPRHMVDRFSTAGACLLAVLSNGELWSAPASGGSWRRILPDVADIRAVAVLP
jgi:photosystem II stability/assembly factor-like uncharacterized protein